MNKRDELHERLDVIIIATRTIVKRLKRLGMRQIIIAQFVNISMAADRLKKRNDLLLTTVKRKTIELEKKLENTIEYVQDHYDITLQSISPTHLDIDTTTKTVRVSITLQSSDWDIIDNFISTGQARSYAGFFRLLTNNFLNDI